MNSSDIIILQSFLNALRQLDQPLPNKIQKQLNEFGKSLKGNSTNIGQLDTIAKPYEPLNEIYKTELTSLVTSGAEKSKGTGNLPPEEKPDPKTPEIINTARDIFNDKNSVEAAKKSKQPRNIFKRLGNLFTNNKKNVKPN